MSPAARPPNPLSTAGLDRLGLIRKHPDKLRAHFEATEVRSLAIGDPAYGELAVGAARMSGGAIHAVPEEEVAARTALLAETTGVFSDSAGGVALGALVELVRTGAVTDGERVILVVTGSGLKPYGYDVGVYAEEIDSDVGAVLAALGVG